MSNNIIIAIYPNTLGFGYVIINNKGEIRDYGVISVRPVNNRKCLDKINELIEYHNPRTLLLEDYNRSRKSRRIRKLNKQLYEEWKQKINVCRYTREKIRDTFEIFGAKNKYEIDRKIVEAYPQFKTKLPDKRKPWEPENYYQGLFDALALLISYQYQE